MVQLSSVVMAAARGALIALGLPVLDRRSESEIVKIADDNLANQMTAFLDQILAHYDRSTLTIYALRSPPARLNKEAAISVGKASRASSCLHVALVRAVQQAMAILLEPVQSP